VCNIQPDCCLIPSEEWDLILSLKLQILDPGCKTDSKRYTNMLRAGFEDVEAILRQPTAGGGAYTRTYTCTCTHIQTHINANILIYTHIYIYDIHIHAQIRSFWRKHLFPQKWRQGSCFLKGEKWDLDKSLTFLRNHRNSNLLPQILQDKNRLNPILEILQEWYWFSWEYYRTRDSEELREWNNGRTPY